VNLADHLGLGLEHHRAGRLAEAARCYQEILAVEEDHADALHLLGVIAHQLGDHSTAIELIESAIELQPRVADYHSNLGNALRAAGRLDDALASYRTALALRPDLVEAHSNLILTLDLDPRADNAARYAERRHWDARHARPLAGHILPHPNDPDPDRRLRVGYVSADFCRHSVAEAVWPILSAHDREAVEITCYSGVVQPDEYTARFQAAADHWRDTAGLSDDALAAQIRQDAIDVLVDLSAYSRGNRLLVFARKPAPVQVTAWGYATGTGLSTMDYFFADTVVVPAEARRYFSEEVFDLPSVLCYGPPATAPPVAPPPAATAGQITFGCFNHPRKVSAETLALWGRVLQAVPTARLVLKYGGFDDPAIQARVREELAGRGVAPERLELRGASPHYEHLAAYADVDLALDPFPHGGGVTTLEAAWLGVPTVTLLEDRISGRVSASILTTIGLADWVAATPDQYVALAQQHAADVEALAAVRPALRGRLANSVICDHAAYCRAVEAAYRTIWRRWCAGQTGARRRAAWAADPRARRL
jgi:predicted O-linked N-acetylglucosamine transferase (SPINDLY family)